ncbi:twin arginine-targeting protein translocase TatC [Aggregatibacter actinomycetemcomitans serotype e str. SC1083]|uniref:Sec-independent protein translocase protein TatC n=1 Tax=Aggregatibacter actinomycetemcomitans serotype e str. SC1083 TaxID=907488 RepID=G4A5D5_AGGAC|nr:twin-arginine translocase subunit TatC [Aggregatibacter actinomycetemcomitans]EGY35325.1 twin arginine-targeting protein translocase TatC [Aggregatibacter actinomycetemcomitans serotype e str. SC1083]EHK90720.1 twin arginine-targeting protein translocase TatC [Aggregatibacter actinomycetemcomitans RhAA1]KNE77768.1 twin-arginine protein translocation system subunit TatC [Aggregatibacter actinomycetemcomitans RhAA1]KYK75584.1 preprotein translocase subunit TatC [Aggregatibacter actinomycetemco
MTSVDDTQPLITHLVELRTRLLHSIIFVVVVFVALVYFSNEIYNFVAAPLTANLPNGSSMIATNIATPFFTPIKLTGVVAVFISVPYLLYQIWAFVAPALYQHEKRLIYPLLFSSTLLFYFGVAFAYYVVFPLVFGFLTKTAPEGVAIATDISSYLDFVLTLFLAFGVCFEVPVAIILLCWTGVTTPEDLRSKRPYIIVAAFFIGMLLTPPDVFSQTLLAAPMCLLFEMGVLCARFYRPREDDDNQNENDSAN